MILLGPRTHAKLNERAVVTEAGEMTIKGFSQPIRVVQLTALVDQ